MINPDKPYIKALDSLRVIAISAVVAVHTTTRTIEATKDNLVAFPWTLFLNQIGRFSVPLFFMVSGFALELNYGNHSSYLAYLKKRASRVLIPFIFWSAIYYFLIYTNNNDSFLRALFVGSASYQLYFIPALIIFYLLFPLLHKIYKFLANKWIFSVLTLIEIGFLYKDYFVKEFNFPDPVHIALLAYIYFVIGMIAARNKERIILFVKKWKYLLSPVTLISGIYVFWEGLSRFLSTGNHLAFYSTWRPSTLVYSIAFALVFFYIFDKSKLQFSITKKLSNLSLFVFFVHVAVLEGLWSITGRAFFGSIAGNPLGKIIFDPLFFALVLFISFLTAAIAHKIPYLHKVTG